MKKKKPTSSWERHQKKQKQLQFAFWVIISVIFLALLSIYIFIEFF